MGITFVALGTSLPDTFASKHAALEDEDADASVGNVTGSNSVNVFLGLGLPWIIGSLYWGSVGPSPAWIEKYEHTNIPNRYPDGAFVVQAGSLAFSVTAYTICATACITVLIFRRNYYGGLKADKYTPG